MSLFFIHGGPGFNSKPEENLLKNEFLKLDNEVHFWNEPSTKRGATGSVNFEKTLEDFTVFFEAHSTSRNILIAHSFGAFTLLHLKESLLKKISQLILISPILNLRALDENIVSLAINESTKLGNTDKAKELAKQKEQFTDKYDIHRFNTTLNALVSVDLLSFYWFNKENMKNYQSFFKEEYEFDIGNFQNIRMSIENEKLSRKIDIPTLILSGEHDQISHGKDMDSLIANCFSRHEIAKLANSAHYPHMEEIRAFFDIVASKLKA